MRKAELTRQASIRQIDRESLSLPVSQSVQSLGQLLNQLLNQSASRRVGGESRSVNRPSLIDEQTSKRTNEQTGELDWVTVSPLACLLAGWLGRWMGRLGAWC